MSLKTQNTIRFYTAVALIFTLLVMALFCGCVENNGNKIPTSLGGLYSFEEDMQGWRANGTDLDSPAVNWSVGRSSEMSTEGNYSVKLYLENLNDAAKIWMEKIYDVDADSLYDVTISYQFATADFGDFNLFNLITTVLGSDFSGRDDLNYEGDTGNHMQTEDFVWLEKHFEYVVETDDAGEIYVNIGVWGSWETTRTYYVDNLNVSIEKLDTVDEYPDISGEWIVTHYNWQGNMTLKENVTIVQNQSAVMLQFDFGVEVLGHIVANTLETPDHDTQFLIKGVDFRGLGINVIYIVNESYMITELPACESCRPSIFIRL
jgi:hypothetical protein